MLSVKSGRQKRGVARQRVLSGVLLIFAGAVLSAPMYRIQPRTDSLIRLSVADRALMLCLVLVGIAKPS